MFGIKTARFERRIENCGFVVRIYRFKDLPVLYSLFNSEIFLKANGVGHTAFSSLLSFCKWIIAAFRTVYVIEVEENHRRRVVGFAGLYDVKAGESLWMSLAIFNPDDRRHGYGQRAVKSILNSLQKNCAVKKVCVEILKTNLPSLCFFEKAGFQVYGQNRDSFLLEMNLGER